MLFLFILKPSHIPSKKAEEGCEMMAYAVLKKVITII